MKTENQKHLDFLKKIKKYIEETEITIDNEWGSCREVKQLIADQEMPDLYNEIIKEIERLSR